MLKIYEVTLVFKTPNEDGRIFDFRTKKSDVIYAIRSFNNQYDKVKTLKLVSIEKQSLNLLLGIQINNDKEATARDLSYFSKRFHHDKGWKMYSRDSTKLFTASVFKNCTDIYINTFNKIPEVKQEISDGLNEEDNEARNKQENIDTNSILSDEMAIKAFEGLISIQDIGDMDTIKKRKDAIIKIKELLNGALK